MTAILRHHVSRALRAPAALPALGARGARGARARWWTGRCAVSFASETPARAAVTSTAHRTRVSAMRGVAPRGARRFR